MPENRSPPAIEYYTDAAHFERDKHDIFYRSWQCVCHVSEVARPGDYATCSIVDEKIFVLRNPGGELRAWYNLCRHRGHPLLEGFGNTGKRLVCPYHAWCYDLSGKVVSVPGASAEEASLCGKLELIAIRVEVLCGFVFVNLDAEARSLTDSFPGLEPELQSFHPDPAALQFVCETSIEHRCNWKISIENYNECYHCPTVHASSLTRGVLDMEGYSIEPHGVMIWHEGKAQTRNEKQYDYDTGHSARADDYAAYWMWPNVALCCYPGGYFTIRQWLPINWRKTIYRYRWFSDGRLAPGDVENLMITHRETTGAEDEVVVARLQQAMESRAYRPGPYIVGDGRSSLSEVGVRHFHRLYRDAKRAAGDDG